MQYTNEGKYMVGAKITQKVSRNLLTFLSLGKILYVPSTIITKQIC